MSKIEKLINNTTTATVENCTVEPFKFKQHTDSCIVEPPYYTTPKEPYIWPMSPPICPLHVQPTKYEIKTVDSTETQKEHVNHPSHYQSKTGMEVIDIIDAFDLNFNLGNVIKYVLRCEKKESDIRDLEKAKWYLEREISNRK